MADKDDRKLINCRHELTEYIYNRNLQCC